ncbi:MAG: FecR family protein [Pseudomonadota bacterium]
MIKLIILVLLFCSPIIMANNKNNCGKDCIGRIVKVIGEVERINTQQNIKGPIKDGQGIVAGDRLKTGKESYVKILMKDDTIFQMGAESEFYFKEFVMKAKDNRHAVYDISFGKLRALFINKAKKNDITLDTPTVSLGIRGTEFALNAFQHNGVWQTDIALLSGQLDVSTVNLNKNINMEKIILDAGKMLQARVELDGKFRPLIISPVLQQQLKKDAKTGGTIFLQDSSSNGAVPKQKVDSELEQNVPISLNGQTSRPALCATISPTMRTADNTPTPATTPGTSMTPAILTTRSQPLSLVRDGGEEPSFKPVIPGR